MFVPCCGCIHHSIKGALKYGLNLQCFMRNDFIKSCEIGALAQYLGFVQMMVCGEKLGSPFCVSLSQEVFIPENGSACTPVLLLLNLCKSYQLLSCCGSFNSIVFHQKQLALLRMGPGRMR